MNVLIVDTSSWIPYFAGKGREAEIDRALAEGRVYLPAIVIAELLSGKLSSKQRNSLVDFLAELPKCDASFEHWCRVGELRRSLLQRGISISTADAHVAQCSIDLDGYLVSEDGIFARAVKYCAFRMLP